MNALKQAASAHLRNIVATLGNIYRRPLNSAVIIFLLGVILSLPLLGFMLIKSLDTASSLLSEQLSMHVYLQNNLTSDEIVSLQQRIDDLGIIRSITFMSKAQSLAQLDSELIDLLSDNPLPDMLILTVKDPRKLTVELANEMEALPGVAMIASDITWINNLTKLISLIKTLTIIFGSLIVLAISIMIANTIKLLLERQREQIKINRLIGATTGFILREFVYYGFWYGLLGSILAITLSSTCILVTKLAIIQVLDEAIDLPWYFLSLENILVTMAIASSLGLLSAAFSITDQLRKIKY